MTWMICPDSATTRNLTAATTAQIVIAVVMALSCRTVIAQNNAPYYTSGPESTLIETDSCSELAPQRRKSALCGNATAQRI